MFHVFVVVLLAQVKLFRQTHLALHLLLFLHYGDAFPMVSPLNASYLEYKKYNRTFMFNQKVFSTNLLPQRCATCRVRGSSSVWVFHTQSQRHRCQKGKENEENSLDFCGLHHCVHVCSMCVWVLLHYSHIALHHLCAGIPPVALKTHHQRVWLHTAEPGHLSRTIKKTCQ